MSLSSFFVSVPASIPRPTHTAALTNFAFKTCTSMTPMVSSRLMLLLMYFWMPWQLLCSWKLKIIVSAGNPPPWRPQVCSMGTQSHTVPAATSIFGRITPPPDTHICAYCVSVGASRKSVTGTNTMELLQATAKQIVFQRLGFFSYEIGSHSLRLGVAMTLHQAHISDSNIKIIGRWMSDALLVYLRVQVATFTKGVSKAMASVP